MLQIFLLIIIVQLGFSAPVFAAPQPQSLDEINEDLQAKKNALEPFDPKKVKVDVESLGLDPVDGKASAPKVSDTKSDTAINQAKPAEAPQPSSGIVSKIKNVFNGGADKIKNLTGDKKDEALSGEGKEAAEDKKSTKEYINLEKKRALKKRLELEKTGAKEKSQKTNNEKKQKEKLRKLNKLREQYLIKIDKNDIENQDILQEHSKIIPQKKELNHFLSDELPPQPILNHYRTEDNAKIPLIPTIADNVDLLFNSIVTNNISVFHEAYKRIENPNIKNKSGDTLLTCATLLRKYAIMSAIINQGADVNKANDLGYDPIGIAIEMLDSNALEILLKNKADINYADNFGRTYLMHAARLGFLPAVSKLIDKGIDINARDNDGFTALAIAYRHKQELVIQYLLKQGAKTWIEKPYEPEKQQLIKELENRWQN